ncbi:MAG: hypothetical protein ING19_05295 [Azospirillum sp.]|nr:hypothetical protein [Azospirillum sp.]
MPPAIAAVTAVVAAGAAYSSGIVLFGTTLVGAGWAAAAVAGAASVALGFVSQALAPKPKGADPGPAIAFEARDRTLAIRQPIVSGKIHVGRLRVSGAQTLIDSTGSNNATLNLLVTLSVRPLGRFDELWLDDQQVPVDWAHGQGIGGNATGKFAGKVKVWYGDGTSSGDAALNAALTAAVGAKWTADHKQTGCAKLYVQLTWDESLFASGTPNVSAVVRCAAVRDPRTGATGWSDNAALALAHYLTIPENEGGFGAALAELDEPALIAAANACDELVTLASKTTTFTADAAADALTLADGGARLRTGVQVRLTTTGTLPGGLATGTDYYVVELATLRIGLATSLANARARTLIDLTSAGTGTHTIQARAEPRYTANGTIDTADEPENVIARLLSACAGRLIRVQGKWEIVAGVWSGASRPALTMDDFAAGFSVAWRREPREAFNGVKGTFVDPDSAWQPTDFPAVSVASYLAEDQNRRVWRADTELPFTLSPSMAQRIARITLERNRRQISTKLTCKLSALDIAAGDTVPVTYPRYGWTNKTFEVGSFKLGLSDSGGDGEGAPAIVVELGLAEIDANVYAWVPADETLLPPSPRTNLPSPGTVAAPTGLVLSSGTTELDVRQDGTVFSRLRADWAAPDDAFVTGGGLIEIQHKKTADADWSASEFVQGAATFHRILDVADGEAYDVRIRARNYLAAVSAWVTATNHIVLGKSAPPADVTAFSAAANGAAVVLRWSPVADLDLDGYDIRYAPAGTTIWGAATPLSQAEGGTSITTIAVPPGEWAFLIRARDASGNLSANPAIAETTIGAIPVAGTNVVVRAAPQAPDWLGVKTDCHVHWTGVLVPNSTKLASEVTEEEAASSFDPYPVAVARYEAPEIDLGFDARVRSYAGLSARLAAGETLGAAVPQLEQDYRLNAGSYDGFEPWSIGTNDLRFAKQAVELRAADGKAVLVAFTPVFDASVRGDEGGVGTAVAIGGTPIVFARRFFAVPNVQATPVGGTVQQAWAEGVTETGFTLRTALGNGTAAAGAANWQATGV